jgi:predicted RNA binding protein YcfA (HicA-like mRNA interferase family)
MLEKRLRQFGYEFVDKTNGGSRWLYSHPDGRELVVTPDLNEHTARQIIRQLERENGQAAKAAKRNPEAIKARHAEERRQLKEQAARLDAERLRLLVERDSLLSGAASHLTNGQLRDLERRVEVIERERRALETLMTERPAPGHGDVKHRAGQR